MERSFLPQPQEAWSWAGHLLEKNTESQDGAAILRLHSGEGAWRDILPEEPGKRACPHNSQKASLGQAGNQGCWHMAQALALTSLPALPHLLHPPRVFFRRHYPLSTLRFCGMDPEQRK